MRVSNGYGKYCAIKFYEITALCLIIKAAVELSMCNDFVVNNLISNFTFGPLTDSYGSPDMPL